MRNVVDFGAFVDIGVQTDGLIHVSKMPRGRLLQVTHTHHPPARQR